MVFHRLLPLLVPAIAALLFIPSGASGKAGPIHDECTPQGVWATWTSDPSSSVTLDWIVPAAEAGSDKIEWRPSRSGQGGEGAEALWTPITTDLSRPLPFADVRIARLHLTGLEADSEQQFRFGADCEAFTVRTVPANTLERPVRLAVGGGLGEPGEDMVGMARAVMAHEPDVLVLGGDLIPMGGDPRNAQGWLEFLTLVRDEFRTPSGRLVPVVSAPGRQEVFRSFHVAPDESSDAREWGVEDGDLPFYDALFGWAAEDGSDRTRYRTIDAGNYLSLVLLDAGHGSEIEGEQAEWLAQALDARVGRAHVIPIYGAAAWPSVRTLDDDASLLLRRHWVPRFEAGGVKLAFENGERAYKRSVPIRGGRPDGNGVIYMGDGGWGGLTASPGLTHLEPAWYLDRAAEARTASIVTLEGPSSHVMALRDDGVLVDEFPGVLTRNGLNGSSAGTLAVELAPEVRGAWAAPPMPREFVEVDPSVLERYLGTFRFDLPGEGPLDLVFSLDEEGSLIVDIPQVGYAGLPLAAESETQFWLEATDADLHFQVEGDGSVDGVEVHFAGAQILAERTR